MTWQDTFMINISNNVELVAIKVDLEKDQEVVEHCISTIKVNVT